jgi:hypothetical protein
MSGFVPPIDGHIHTGPYITSPEDALKVISHGLSQPVRPEVFVIVRNHAQQMLMMLVVTDTVAPDHVVDVLHSVLQVSIDTDLDSIVLASMRPGTPICIDDTLIWWTLQDQADLYGIELTEWFVLSEDFLDTNYAPSPRIFTGEEAAW